MFKKLTAFILFCTLASAVRGQVIISLLLGDKLNSGKIEFGLEGGVNFPSVSTLDGSAKSRFNLGFYFDIKTKNPHWLVHTGVMVKATLGMDDLPVYYLNDSELDTSFIGGNVDRKLNYFNCPLLMKYLIDKRFSVQAGIMPSLRYKSYDYFENNNGDDELTYKKNISDQYHQIDFGIMTGVCYRLMGGNGMNLSVQYYYGLTDITKDNTSPAQYNRSLYLSLGIPIGAGKAKEREAKKL
jgi:hypothetical protein